MSGGGETKLEHAIAPVCAGFDVELIDVELRAGILTVTIDRSGGLDLDLVAEVSRAVSDLLDADEQIAPDGNYELEVSSPGLERRLRQPKHFHDAIGSAVAIRTMAGTPGDRRINGTITQVDKQGIELALEGAATRRLLFDEIERAKTVVDWQAALREGKARTKGDKVATS